MRLVEAGGAWAVGRILVLVAMLVQMLVLGKVVSREIEASTNLLVQMLVLEETYLGIAVVLRVAGVGDNWPVAGACLRGGLVHQRHQWHL